MAKTVRAHGHTSDTSMRCQDPECREPATWSLEVTEMSMAERAWRVYGSMFLALILFTFAISVARDEAVGDSTIMPAVLFGAGLLVWTFAIESRR